MNDDLFPGFFVRLTFICSGKRGAFHRPLSFAGDRVLFVKDVVSFSFAVVQARACPFAGFGRRTQRVCPRRWELSKAGRPRLPTERRNRRVETFWRCQFQRATEAGLRREPQEKKSRCICGPGCADEVRAFEERIDGVPLSQKRRFRNPASNVPFFFARLKTRLPVAGGACNFWLPGRRSKRSGAPQVHLFCTGTRPGPRG